MSKRIKQMEMDDLRETFQDVRDLVFLTSSKLGSQANTALRHGLRKKHIRLKVVKNSLARRVFDDLGMRVTRFWEGQTVVAWGSSSLADLSKELDALARKNDKVLKVKGAVAEGQEISFPEALKMPTRAEALGRIVSLALSPASRIVSQILAPASNIAGQIKTLQEREEAATTPAAESQPS